LGLWGSFSGVVVLRLFSSFILPSISSGLMSLFVSVLFEAECSFVDVNDLEVVDRVELLDLTEPSVSLLLKDFSW
jgi:hypothetical protein